MYPGENLDGCSAREYGIDLVLTVEPELPVAPAPIEPGNIVGSPPPAITQEADGAVQSLLEK